MFFNSSSSSNREIFQQHLIQQTYISATSADKYFSSISRQIFHHHQAASVNCAVFQQR